MTRAPLLALFCCTSAAAFDAEPNDSCAASEAVPRYLRGQGALAATDLSDAFTTGRLPPGVARFTLRNLSNPDDDFALSLTDSAGAVLDSATSADGAVRVEASLTSADALCLTVTGSPGDYALLADLVQAPPVVTDVRDSSGASITSAAPGDVVTVVGEVLGAASANVTVSFGGAYGQVRSVSPVAVEVVVPANGADGDLILTHGAGRSDPLPFRVGGAALPATRFTPPDPAWRSPGPADRLILNRTLVQFDAGATAAEVGALLDAVAALDSQRAGWSDVGFSPLRNTWQIEWSFTAGFVPTLADWETLAADLLAEGALGVDPELPVKLFGLAEPADVDLLYDSGASRGALAQIGFEEARRRLWSSGGGGLLEAPAVIVLDSGLLFGTGDWDPTRSCLGGATGGSARLEELPDDRFGLFELDASGQWSATAAPGHAASLAGPAVHGDSVAALIGAASQADPDWADGAARAGLNTSGLLAGQSVIGVDDDGDGDVDEAGEQAPYQVWVYNGLSTGSAGDPMSSAFYLEALDAIAADPSLDGAVVVLAGGWPFMGAAGGLGWQHQAQVLQSLCATHLVVAAAGNSGEELDVGSGASCKGGATANALASDLACLCPDRALVVGGVEAGGNGAGTDTRLDWGSLGLVSNTGGALDLLAPASGLTVAAACQRGGAVDEGYFEGWAGTSAAAALVGGAAALGRAAVDREALSDEALALILREASDSLRPVYTARGPAGRLDLFSSLDELLWIGGAPRDRVRVFAVDYGAEVLVAEDVLDLSTGELAGSGARDTVAVDTEGCLGPSDVAAHPSGDVVYVLCADSDTVTAWSSAGLDYLGEVALEGDASSYSELALSPDGLLWVPTLGPAGELLLESFDTWRGDRHLEAEVVYDAAALGLSVGVDVAPWDGAVVISGTDNDAGTEDGDLLARALPSVREKAASDLALDDLSSTALTTLLRQARWAPDGSGAVGVLYGDGSGSDEELVFADWDGRTDVATVDHCEDVVALALAADGLAYLSCQDNHAFQVVDLSAAASSYTPLTSLYGGVSSSVASRYTPTTVELAQNGLFAALGFQYTSTGSSWSWVVTVEHALAAGGGSLYTGDYDLVGYAGFQKPRGLAISPLVSLVSPRPGMALSGVRTLVARVRDPAVVEVEFVEGADVLCADAQVLDGEARCRVDTTGWSSGEHSLAIRAKTASGSYEGWAIFWVD